MANTRAWGRRCPGWGGLMGAVASVVVVLFAAFLASAAMAQEAGADLVDGGACGSLENAFGPYDYRKIPPTALDLVNRGHFTLPVQMLQHGQSTYIGGDLDYALRAIPNYPAVLLAMVREAQRERTDQPRGARYGLRCWFDRAVQFVPDDPMVRVLYANYLAKKGEQAKALEELRVAEGVATDDANLQYNFGLAYFRLREYAPAFLHAKKAYALGFPLPGLRDMLVAVGKWQGDGVASTSARRIGDDRAKLTKP